MADGREPGRVQHVQRGRVADGRGDGQPVQPAPAGLVRHLAEQRPADAAAAHRRGHHDRVDLAGAAVQHQPDEGDDAVSSWSATHMPDEVELGEVLLEAGARVAVGRRWRAVERAAVLDQFAPERAAGVVVGGPVRADRDAVQAAGRRQRFRHTLMLTPVSARATAYRDEKSDAEGVDLAYLRAHPEHLPDISDPSAHPGDAGGRRLDLPGQPAHPRRRHLGLRQDLRRPRGGRRRRRFFDTEAAGLRWLREAGATGGVGVPEVIAALPDLLALEWVDPGRRRRRGRALRARAGRDAPGRRRLLRRAVAGLHRVAAAGQHSRAPARGAEWFAERRLRPYLRTSADRGALSAADVALVERVLTDIEPVRAAAEPPARLHGDLWPGNLLWATDGRVCSSTRPPTAVTGRPTWPSSPSSAGPRTSTAILAAYQEVWPLADGWRERVPLHQLHLLLVHTALFGAAYRDSVVDRGPGGPARLIAGRLTGCGRVTVGGATVEACCRLQSTPLVDRFGRVATDLRVSLTDRCNLRCTYCMPEEGLAWLPKQTLLTDDEVVRLVRIAARAARRDRGPVHRRRAAAAARAGRGSWPSRRRCGPGPRLSLTTNGIGLTRLAAPLRRRRPRPGQRLAGHAAPGAVRGAGPPAPARRRARRAAGRGHDAGLRPVKINTVLMRGVNDDEAVDLLDFALAHGYELRFIEQMPLDAQHAWRREDMVTAEEILAQLRTVFTLHARPGGAGRGAGRDLAGRGPHDGRRRRRPGSA